MTAPRYRDAEYRRGLFLDVATYLPPKGDGWARWTLKLGPVRLMRVARHPWDYWVLIIPVGKLQDSGWPMTRLVSWGPWGFWIRGLDWHFGAGWRKHMARIKAGRFS